MWLGKQGTAFDARVLGLSSAQFSLNTAIACHIHYHIVPRPQSMSLCKTGSHQTLFHKCMRSMKNKYWFLILFMEVKKGALGRKGEQDIGSQTTQVSFLPLPLSSPSSAPGKWLQRRSLICLWLGSEISQIPNFKVLVEEEKWTWNCLIFINTFILELKRMCPETSVNNWTVSTERKLLQAFYTVTSFC